MSFRICIPTRGRPKNQATLAGMPEQFRKMTTLFVRKDEEKAYREQWIGKVGNIKVIPEWCVNLGTTRQYIVEMCVLAGVDCIMADDDLKMFVRHPYGHAPIGKTDTLEWSRLIRSINYHLQHNALVGVPGRFLANTLPQEDLRDTRIACFFGINSMIVEKVGARYGEILVQVDHDFNLQLLLAGYRNRVLTQFAHDQKFDAPGGCQNYRNQKTLAAASKLLKARYPKFVTTFVKKSKSTWKTMQGERLEVRIAWKKAAQYGKEHS